MTTKRETEHPLVAKHPWTGEPLYVEDTRPHTEQLWQYIEQHGCDFCHRPQPLDALALLVPSPERMRAVRGSSSLPRFPGSDRLPPWPVCRNMSECLAWFNRCAEDDANDD